MNVIVKEIVSILVATAIGSAALGGAGLVVNKDDGGRGSANSGGGSGGVTSAPLSPDHIHSYEEDIIEETTCFDTGEREYSCWCGDSYTLVIPKIEHDYYEGYCLYCGGKDPSWEEHVTHTWSSTPEILSQPTCRRYGEARYSCTYPGCDEYDYVTLSKVEHKYSETPSEKVDATCMEDGYAVYKCVYSGCSVSERVVLNKTGHIISGSGGTCSKCGFAFDPDEVPPHEHVWASEPVESTPATCISMGTELYNCLYPGCDSYEFLYTPTTAHSPEAVPGCPATCTESGVTAGNACSVCGTVFVEQQVIPAQGHSISMDSGADGYCMDCGEWIVW